MRAAARALALQHQKLVASPYSLPTFRRVDFPSISSAVLVGMISSHTNKAGLITDRGIPRSTMEVEDGDDVLVVVVVA